MGTALVVYKPQETEKFKINLRSPYGDLSSDMPIWALLDLLLFSYDDYDIFLYTVGSPHIHDPILTSGEYSIKSGENKETEYPGGILFVCPEDAYAFLEEHQWETYAVYRVKTTNTNVVVRGKSFHLRKDAPIISKHKK